MAALTTANSGDVIFLANADAGTKASICLQPLIDPDAKSCTRQFGHVAIVIGDLIALEAMPSDVSDGTATEALTGEWSGASLASGVRLLPIADLVVPAMREGSDILVLRCPDAPEHILDGMGAAHPAIAAMIGSAYSIELLKEQAKTIFWPKLVDLADPKLGGRSVPRDLATRVGLDVDLRNFILEKFPGIDIPRAAQTYFCSQLVIAVLKIVGLLPEETATDLTTPTGLCALLTEKGWTDVTKVYRCPPDTDRFFAMTPAGTDASYTNSRAIAGIAAQHASSSLEANILRSALQKMSARCDEVLDKLGKS